MVVVYGAAIEGSGRFCSVEGFCGRVIREAEALTQL